MALYKCCYYYYYYYYYAIIKQCLGKVAEINGFSAFDEML